MEAAIEVSDHSEFGITLVHALPGRLRIHLSGWQAEERDAIEAIIRRGRGVESVRANPLTGNVLVQYDTAFTDVATVLRTIRTALVLSEYPSAPADGGALTLEHEREASELGRVRQELVLAGLLQAGVAEADIGQPRRRSFSDLARCGIQENSPHVEVAEVWKKSGQRHNGFHACIVENEANAFLGKTGVKRDVGGVDLQHRQ